MDSFESQLQQLSSLCTNSEVNDLASKIDSLDNQSGRNNLIIDGLTQYNTFESWPDSEKKVREFFNDKLKIDPKSIEIERAHHIGNLKQQTTTTKPRAIVVKFLCYKDKELIQKHWCLS